MVVYYSFQYYCATRGVWVWLLRVGYVVCCGFDMRAPFGFSGGGVVFGFWRFGQGFWFGVGSAFDFGVDLVTIYSSLCYGVPLALCL